MGRRPRDIPPSDRQILDALPELLRERQIHEISVEDIVRAAGLSRQSFYKHFDTKYAALARLVEEVVGQITPMLQPSEWNPDSEPLHAWARRVVDDAARAWDAHSDILVACYQAAETDPTVRRLVDAAEAGWAAILAAAVRTWADAGLLEPFDPDIDEMAVLFARLGARTLYRMRLNGGPAFGQERTNHALAVYLTAMAGERPPAGRLRSRAEQPDRPALEVKGRAGRG